MSILTMTTTGRYCHPSRRHMLDEFFNVIATVRWVGNQYVKVGIRRVGPPNLVAIFLFVVDCRIFNSFQMVLDGTIAIVRIIQAQLLVVAFSQQSTKERQKWLYMGIGLQW